MFVENGLIALYNLTKFMWWCEMNRIKDYRVAAGMKQSDLAEALCTKQTTVSGWEIGRREPDFDALFKMADLFGCTVDELLGREKAPTVETDGERRLLDISRLNPENQDRLEDYMSLLLTAQDKN